MNPLTETKTTQEVTSEELVNVTKAGLDSLEWSWRRCYELVWHNPYGLSPQQVIDILGKDAQAVFLESYQIGELLIAHGRKMTNAPPEGVKYKANPDGSITLN